MRIIRNVALIEPVAASSPDRVLTRNRKYDIAGRGCAAAGRHKGHWAVALGPALGGLHAVNVALGSPKLNATRPSGLTLVSEMFS